MPLTLKSVAVSLSVDILPSGIYSVSCVGEGGEISTRANPPGLALKYGSCWWQPGDTPAERTTAERESSPRSHLRTFAGVLLTSHRPLSRSGDRRGHPGPAPTPTSLSPSLRCAPSCVQASPPASGFAPESSPVWVRLGSRIPRGTALASPAAAAFSPHPQIVVGPSSRPHDQRAAPRACSSRNDRDVRKACSNGTAADFSFRPQDRRSP